MSYAKHYSAKPTIDKLNKFVQSYPGWLDAQISNIADRIENEAQNTARRRTGRMANMTTKKKIKRGDAIGYEISGTAPYTIFQHEGTRYIDADPYIMNAFEKYSPLLMKLDYKKLFAGGGGGGSWGVGW